MKAKPKSKSLRISPNKNIKIKKLINFPPKKKSISKEVSTSRKKSMKSAPFCSQNASQNSSTARTATKKM